VKTRLCLLLVCGIAVAIVPGLGSSKPISAHFGLRVKVPAPGSLLLGRFNLTLHAPRGKRLPAHLPPLRLHARKANVSKSVTRLVAFTRPHVAADRRSGRYTVLVAVANPAPNRTLASHKAEPPPDQFIVDFLLALAGQFRAGGLVVAPFTGGYFDGFPPESAPDEPVCKADPPIESVLNDLSRVFALPDGPVISLPPRSAVEDLFNAACNPAKAARASHFDQLIEEILNEEPHPPGLEVEGSWNHNHHPDDPYSHLCWRIRSHPPRPGIHVTVTTTEGTEILSGGTQTVTLDDKGEALVVVRIHFHSDPFAAIATTTPGGLEGSGEVDVGGRPDEDAPFPCP